MTPPSKETWGFTSLLTVALTVAGVLLYRLVDPADDTAVFVAAWSILSLITVTLLFVMSWDVDQWD